MLFDSPSTWWFHHPRCFWSSSRFPSNYVINGIGFEACHEINAFPREFFPPVVNRLATIHANHASWLVIEAFSHINLMFFACSGNHEVWQIAIVIETKMKLESAFGLRVSCPWKDVKAQLNCCRIHQNQAVHPGQFELWAWRECLAWLQHLLEDILKKICTPFIIHTRKGGSTDGRLNAEMVKPFLLALLSLLNFTKALQPKYLSHEHHYELDVSACLASSITLAIFSV